MTKKSPEILKTRDEEIPNKAEKGNNITDEELLKKYLKSEEEIQNFKGREDYNDRIKELREYDEKKSREINNKLYELEKKTTSHIIEKKYTVNELIEELEKNKSETKIKIPKTAKETKEIVEEKIATTKEDVKKSFREEIEKKGPIMGTIGTFLFDWVEDLKNKEDKDFLDKIGIKIGMAILGAFIGADLMKKYKDKLDDLKNNTLTYDSTKLEAKTKGLVESVDQTLTKTKQTVSLPEEGKENKEEKNKIENEKKLIYIGGINFLLHFSGDKIEATKPVLKKLYEKNLKYKDLKTLEFNKKNFPEDYNNNKFKENFNEIINTLSNENAQKILKVSLKKENLEKIIEQNKDSLGKLIGNSRLLEIESQLKNNNFSYEDLTLNEISIFLYKGFNSLAILGFEQIEKEFGELKEFILEDSNINFEGVKQEIIGKRKNLISDNLIKKFFQEGGKETGGKIFMEKNYKDLEKSFKLDNEKDKEQLKKIFEFKEWLLGDFLNEKKTFLKSLGYEEKFKDSLDYRGVILLYILFAGKKDINNLSTFDLPVLYKTISVIINKNSPGRGSAYLTEVSKNILFNDEKNIFDKDEKDVLEIVGKKLFVDYMKNTFKNLAKTLGLSGLVFADNFTGDFLTMGAGGLIIKYSKWIPQMRLFGLAVAGVGALSLASDVHSAFKEEIEGLFPNEKDGEIKVKDYIKKIESFKEKLKQEEIEIDGEKKKVIFYKGKNGLEVIYNKGIYRVDIGPNIFDGDIMGINSSTKDVFNGKDIEFSLVNFKQKDGKDYIVFGKGENSIEIPLNDFIEAIKNNKFKYIKDITGKDTNAEYLVIKEAKKESNNGNKNDGFIDLTKLISSINSTLNIKQDLILRKIGEIKEKS